MDPWAPEPVEEESGVLPVKLVVCGGYGAGKTTFVGAISEIVPLTTEAPLTEVSLAVDQGAGIVFGQGKGAQSGFAAGGWLIGTAA